MPGTIQSPMDSVKDGLASKPLSTQLMSSEREAFKCEVSLLSAFLPTKKTNTVVLVHLCAFLFVTNSALSANLGCLCFGYRSASRSKVKQEVGFIRKLSGVYVCVWSGLGVMFRYLLRQSGSSKKQMSDTIRRAADLLEESSVEYKEDREQK